MTDSWKCPHCEKWIGSMQVHEDCARKQDEKKRREKAERDGHDRRRYGGWMLCLLLGSACDTSPCPTPTPHEIAHDDSGCVTMQVGYDWIYYTRCDGRPSTSGTECHWVQDGKLQRRVCSSTSTVDPDDPGPGCCPRERAQ